VTGSADEEPLGEGPDALPVDEATGDEAPGDDAAGEHPTNSSIKTALSTATRRSGIADMVILLIERSQAQAATLCCDT